MTQFARKIDSVNLIRKIRFLRSVPFLQEAYVPDAQMQAVASLFEYQVYDFDETVCEEEEATSAFYIVCSGHVGSFMSLHGFEVHLNDLKTGDYTGEVALVERMHNIITLRAFNRSTLLELPVTKFDKLLEISAGMRQYLSLHGRQRTASALRRYQVTAALWKASRHVPFAPLPPLVSVFPSPQARKQLSSAMVCTALAGALLRQPQ
eukprot:scaffold247_cov274-Pinguiococcus_pyrenoidosus.AAC.11